jgi:hypothetical protein
MAFADPHAAEQAFYAAFRELDTDAMRRVWLDSDSSSCIHPGGGLLQGIGVVLASWSEIFRDSAPPRIEYKLIQASSDEHLAVHTVQESVSSGGGQHHAVILATNIYTLTDGGWRMLAHHASLPLVESNAERPGPAPLH